MAAGQTQWYMTIPPGKRSGLAARVPAFKATGDDKTDKTREGLRHNAMTIIDNMLRDPEKQIPMLYGASVKCEVSLPKQNEAGELLLHAKTIGQIPPEVRV